MKLSEAVAKVREDYPQTEDHSSDWLFFVKVLKIMGFKIDMEFSREMPSPDSIMREWRRQSEEKEKIKAKKGYIPTKQARAESFPNSQFMP